MGRPFLPSPIAPHGESAEDEIGRQECWPPAICQRGGATIRLIRSGKRTSDGLRPSDRDIGLPPHAGAAPGEPLPQSHMARAAAGMAVRRLSVQTPRVPRIRPAFPTAPRCAGTG
jgi:hypothetical protein